MFSVEERDLIRWWLLHLAEQDPAVVAAAITGSHATPSATPKAPTYCPPTSPARSKRPWSAPLMRPSYAVRSRLPQRP
ncbi:hypothetical protein [Micromonospora zamorensis]|uniref:hypothetical protein n=1 Tax=Micromonospora zamorensis TaxID=709883 RepID=UPI0033BDFCBE